MIENIGWYEVYPIHWMKHDNYDNEQEQFEKFIW